MTEPVPPRGERGGASGGVPGRGGPPPGRRPPAGGDLPGRTGAPRATGPVGGTGSARGTGGPRGAAGGARGSGRGSGAGSPGSGGRTAAGRDTTSRRPARDRTRYDRTPPGTRSGRAPSEPAPTDRVASDRVASDRTASDRTASDRTASDRTRSARTAPDRARSPAERPAARRPGTGERGPRRSSSAPVGRWPITERSLLPTVLGVPPLAAVGAAAALTALGVVVDLLRAGTLGAVFTVCYLTGCVLGVAWVRRSALFWPMVVPPLLMAVAVPVVVLLAGAPKPGAGVAQRLLVIGAPLVNGFPMMAWTTGLALAVGLFRIATQRLPKAPVSAPRGRGAARGAARTSASPRRS